jgi:serine protease Do
LFDDDFYKSKSTQHQGIQGKAFFGFVLLAVGVGLLLTVLVFPYLAKRGYVEVDMSSQRSEKISAVAERVEPAIVSVFGYEDQANMEIEEMQDYSIGSGVIIKKDREHAQIVTNYHVINGASDIEIMLNTGERLDATLVAKDALSDLALLEVKSSRIKHTAVFGNSDRLRVGETAIAIGNPLGLGNTPTITTGVISSIKRTVPVSTQNNEIYDWELDVIQTDAAVNEGNSGGALLNLRGELVGIISMKMLEIGVEGLAFAVPINQAEPILEQMMRERKVNRPYMGIEMQDLNELVGTDTFQLPPNVKKGVIVIGVDGPAKAAGLREGDVIVQLDEQVVEDVIDLRKYLYLEKRIGERLRISFYRQGKLQDRQLRLEELKTTNK